jgi:NAD+ kinase
VPPVASFSLGSLGFLTPFDFSRFQDTLTESFDKGVTVRLRMRFECTIFRWRDHDEMSDSEDPALEIHHSTTHPSTHSHGDGAKMDWRDHEETYHSNEYQPAESFSVLNELVVVRTLMRRFDC